MYQRFRKGVGGRGWREGLAGRPREGLADYQDTSVVLAKMAPKLCAHIVGKPPPQYSAIIVQAHPGQISHNLCTCLDAPAHLSHKFFGVLSGLPCVGVTHNFLGHMACSQNLPLYKQ